MSINHSHNNNISSNNQNISDKSDKTSEQNNASIPVDASQIIPNRARIDLTTIEIPDTARTIILKSEKPNTKLTLFNPFTVAESIDEICGPIKQLKYLRSGNLLIRPAIL